MEFGLNFTEHQKEPPALSEQGEEEVVEGEGAEN